MPQGEKGSHGLQLWVNLAKANKMVAPAYQELKDQQIPRGEKDGVTVKVIAGKSMDITVWMQDFQQPLACIVWA